MRECVRMYVCVCVCVYIYICICVYVYIYIHTYIYVDICDNLNVCVCVSCVYVHLTLRYCPLRPYDTWHTYMTYIHDIHANMACIHAGTCSNSPYASSNDAFIFAVLSATMI